MSGRMLTQGCKYIFLFTLLLILPKNRVSAQIYEVDSVSKMPCTSSLDSNLKLVVYTFADKKAEFPGGEKAMMQFIQANLKYPLEGHCMTGTVFVELVFNEEGKIIRKAIRRSVHKSLDEEALRVMDRLPMFIPAECYGKRVPFLLVLPIKFMLR